MTQEIKLSQGYPQREAAAFANEVKGIAARFPNDPFALRLVMETAFLANDMAGATDAANRLLAVQPDNARALTIKGTIQVNGLAAAQNRDAAAWNAARAPLLRARQAAPRDPVVLRAFYRGYALQGGMPPEEAQNALYDAMELAPSDGEIRYELASDFERRRMIPEAIAVIRPEANSFPHRGNESDADRRRREELEERNRQAGTVRHETPLEMLNRLQALLTPHQQEPQANSQPEPPMAQAPKPTGVMNRSEFPSCFVFIGPSVLVFMFFCSFFLCCQIFSRRSKAALRSSP